jgi:hypothetical protein
MLNNSLGLLVPERWHRRRQRVKGVGGGALPLPGRREVDPEERRLKEHHLQEYWSIIENSENV